LLEDAKDVLQRRAILVKRRGKFGHKGGKSFTFFCPKILLRDLKKPLENSLVVTRELTS